MDKRLSRTASSSMTVHVRHLLISGLVQGVGFRYGLHAAATGAGVTGWVRNRRDGRVEAVVQGTPAQLEAILRWARRGPPGARVDEIVDAEATGYLTMAYARFEHRPTV
jgi:acylphosphatase